MRKIFTFMLLAAALLVSVPSWAHMYPDGTEKTFEELGMPHVNPDLSGAHFGTICVPQRIVATQGVRINDVVCVDVEPKDTTKVARLVIDVHTICYGYGQDYYDGHQWYEAYSDEPFCPYEQGTGANSCEEKVYIDWAYNYNEATQYDYRMKAGAAYFYQVCDNGTATTLAERKIWVDKNDSASAPVCQNGFYGTFEQTTINFPVTVLTQDVETKKQYLEQVTKVTMPANRGYFKGNFECVPWRWNTFSKDFTEEFQKEHGVTTAINPLHYPCSAPPKVPRRLSSNAVAFNVGRDGNGLYTIDFEHPIYLGQETNKRIENGQLIIEAADGSIYNAFGLKLR